MNTEIFIHERENNELSEEFLKANGKKFGQQCVQVLRLLYKGMKLTAKQTNDILNIADGGRRLREIMQNRNDVRKQKRYSADGSLEGMEYWLEIPGYPTKEELTKWFSEYQNETPIRYIKGEKGVGDYARALIEGAKTNSLIQKNLF